MLGRTVVLGPGLLGGSLGLAVADQGHPVVVWGRRHEPLEFLSKIESSELETESDLAKAARGAGLIVLATPIGVMPDLLERLVAANVLAPGVVITDVGSVKRPIVEHAMGILKGTGAHFVGSHPMAGSEASGIEAARKELYKGALCLITPIPETDEDALANVRDFWVTLGMRVHEAPPAKHDEIVARISHLPHALASLVVGAALEKEPSWAEFSAGGLRDTTRVASGDPAMWAEILLENRQAVLAALRDSQERLEDLIQCMESGQIEPLQRFLLEAKALRDTHIVPRC